MIAAAGIAAGIHRGRNGPRRRAPNKIRKACASTESLCLSARVSEQENNFRSAKTLI